jgi:SnoaL-like domain
MSEDRFTALEAKLAALETRLARREDELDVRSLQYIYGYLIDKCMYDQVVDLFADDGEVRCILTGSARVSPITTMARLTASCSIIRKSRRSSPSLTMAAPQNCADAA